MKRRRVLFMHLSQFRLFLRRLILTLVVLSAFALVFLNKAEDAYVNKSQDVVSRVLNPIIRVLQLPADGLYFTYEKIKDIVLVYNENRLLKEKTRQFDEMQNTLSALQIENELLSEMLVYKAPPEATFVTAKIVANEGDGFSHSLIAYVPDKQVVQKGQVVLYRNALIGRVDAVRGSYVRVMLISDISSKIPVVIERTREKGILSGDNTQILHLLFTASNADIKKGDKVVTSAIGGMFPSDLIIGYVLNVGETDISVVPLHDISKAEYIQIVQYNTNWDVLFEDSTR